MAKITNYLMAIAILVFFIESADAQTGSRGSSRPRAVATSNQSCVLNGTYRVDVINSDRLYSVVKSATSTVPFGDQQQFFMDLSTRLTPPDILAIECRGQYVTVGSSRANKITYLADGKDRRERSRNGEIVNSKVTLTNNSLSFVSAGRVEDNVNVTFDSLDNGRRLRATRRIYAKQLSEPIVIHTIYDRLSESVDWKIYERDLVARDAAARNPAPDRPADASEQNRVESLRNEFAAWLEATNRRDIDAQMRFYMPQMKAYYLTRNTPRRTVRLEKERVFGAVRSVDIRTGDPEIIFQNQGRTAVMRFVKE